MRKKIIKLFKRLFRNSVVELKNISIVEEDGYTLRNDLLVRALLLKKEEK